MRDITKERSERIELLIVEYLLFIVASGDMAMSPSVARQIRRWKSHEMKSARLLLPGCFETIHDPITTTRNGASGDSTPLFWSLLRMSPQFYIK